MIKNILIFISCALNIALLFILIDLGITVAYSESDAQFLKRRNDNLFKDLSNIYLCKNIDNFMNKKMMNEIKLNGVILYIKDDFIYGIGFKGEPSLKEECHSKL